MGLPGTHFQGNCFCVDRSAREAAPTRGWTDPRLGADHRIEACTLRCKARLRRHYHRFLALRGTRFRAAAAAGRVFGTSGLPMRSHGAAPRLLTQA